MLGPYPIVVLVNYSVDVGHEVLLEAGDSQLLDFLARLPPHLYLASARMLASLLVLATLFLRLYLAICSVLLFVLAEVDGSASAVLVDHRLQLVVLSLECQYFLVVRMHVHLLVPHDEPLYFRTDLLQNPLLRLPIRRSCMFLSLRTRVIVFPPLVAVELDPYVLCSLLGYGVCTLEKTSTRFSGSAVSVMHLGLCCMYTLRLLMVDW